MTAEQRIWEERLRRATWRSKGVMNPVVREVTAEMRRAVADADTYEEKSEAIRAAKRRIGEHVGLGPRPG